MAPARRHLLLILLLVALHARAARAAPWRARQADEDDGSPYPASQLDVALDPLEQPGDPLQVDGFPTYWPLPVLNPESRPTAVPIGEGNVASRMGSGDEPPQAGAVLSEPGEDRHGRVYEFYRTDSGEVEKTPARASNAHRSAGRLCPSDVRWHCLISAVAIILSVPAAIMLCYIIIRVRRKMKQRITAATGYEPNARDLVRLGLKSTMPGLDAVL